MNRSRISILGGLALIAGLAAWAAIRGQKPAYAAQTGATPGQLTIVDKKGNTVGLCALKHTDVLADIAGYVSRVTVTQEFSNPSTTPAEAVYTFPLPGDAAVDDMTMVIGKRIVRGQIMKREEAREVYEAAKNAGQAASLLDQERPNIFTQSVANIMPGENVKIVISYVNLLKYQEGKYEFVFPMVVGPRFVPTGGYTSPGKRGEPSAQQSPDVDPGKTPVVLDSHKITPPITPQSTRAGHDISVRVNLDAGIPIQQVASTLHAVTIRRIGRTRAEISLKDQATLPNKDFILKYTAAGSEIQSGILTHALLQGGVAGRLEEARMTNGYFTLILQPPAAPPQQMVSSKEMVFVIDQTGSQSGWPIAKAKETMRYCIKNMNPGDTFQLLAFNTSVYPCFDAPVPANQETVAKALKFLEPIEGNGGTDILKAVDYALRIPDDPERLRIICYMTDGYVGNDVQIIDYVKKYRGRARMFPFGIGNSVNRFLIDGMAREGRGAAEYVTIDMNAGAVMGTSRELTGKALADAKDVAARFYQRIASPVLLDPQIEWNGLPVEDVYPKNIPDVFSSGPIIVKGRYTHGAEGDVTIRGILRGKPWSQTIHVQLPALKQDAAAIQTLWARDKIEDLQSQDWLGAQLGKPDPAIKDQIVNTALEHRLMSQYTSFVAVEEKVVNIGGKQRTVDVPVEMPEGVSYGGIFGESEKEVKLGRAVQFGMNRGLSTSFAAGSNLYWLQTNARAESAPLGGGGAGGGLAVRALSSPAPMAKLKAEALKPSSSVNGVLGQAAVMLDEAKAVDRLSEIDSYGLMRGNKDAIKRLGQLKPEERKTVLRRIKLAEVLQTLAEKVKKEGKSGNLDKPGLPKVENGIVEVQIWLNDLPPDGIAKLKAILSKITATLIPNKLVLVTVNVDKLDALIELPFVRKIELPKIK